MAKIYRIKKINFQEVKMYRRLSKIRFTDEFKKFPLRKNKKENFNIISRTLNGEFYLLTI